MDMKNRKIIIIITLIVLQTIIKAQDTIMYIYYSCLPTNKWIVTNIDTVNIKMIDSVYNLCISNSDSTINNIPLTNIDSIIFYKALPIITTTAISSILPDTASCGGTIICNGGTTVITSGICWSTSANPTIADSKTIDSLAMGSFTSTITGLSTNTTYYVRAYATSSIGTGYGNLLSFTTSTVSIGSNYQGGKVAYILQPGDSGYLAGQIHGLIAAPSDQSTAVIWASDLIPINATDTAIGTGKANTDTIVGVWGISSYAAYLCDTLNLNGYGNWYLPSLDELNELYLNEAIIGGFAPTGIYWSSSEATGNSAWEQNFQNGLQAIQNKSTLLYVRAIRSF